MTLDARIAIFFRLILTWCSAVIITSFAPPVHYRSTAAIRHVPAPCNTNRNMLPEAWTDVSSLIVATIDSDIANIPQNEFAPVFMGGIVVMFGGLVSAIVVGTIIDKRNLYASIVADSYAQSEDDEEFWKGLSEEEKIKTRELLRKIKESSNGGTGGVARQEAASPSPESIQSRENMEVVLSNTNTSNQSPANEKQKSIGMFSDYED